MTFQSHIPQIHNMAQFETWSKFNYCYDTENYCTIMIATIRFFRSPQTCLQALTSRTQQNTVF